jgi:hypothetical protein
MENFEMIFSIVMGVLTIIGGGLSLYFNVKSKILDAANSAVNTAEDSDKVKEEKMALAISEVKKLIPAAARPFFTDRMIETIIQKAFDGIEAYAEKQAKKTQASDAQ